MEHASDQPQPIPVPRWVISDTHLGHANILEYCPWRQTWAKDLIEHDAAIVAEWQAVVKPDDWVLHLGDFALGNKERLPKLRRQLPGRIVLVRGNHDRSLANMRAAGFDLVCSAISIDVDGRQWIGRHNPSAFSIREARHATRLLHGHSHGNGYSATIHPSITSKAFDCSLDALHSVGPVPWNIVQ